MHKFRIVKLAEDKYSLQQRFLLFWLFPIWTPVFTGYEDCEIYFRSSEEAKERLQKALKYDGAVEIEEFFA